MAERDVRGVPLPRLREVRMRAPMTQNELATESGVSRPTIARAEAGLPIRPTIVRRLARVLGVRPQELMAPEEDEEREQAVA
jgi:transcriptional regulator with XRE-family HTH domain